MQSICRSCRRFDLLLVGFPITSFPRLRACCLHGDFFTEHLLCLRHDFVVAGLLDVQIAELHNLIVFLEVSSISSNLFLHYLTLSNVLLKLRTLLGLQLLQVGSTMHLGWKQFGKEVLYLGRVHRRRLLFLLILLVVCLSLLSAVQMYLLSRFSVIGGILIFLLLFLCRLFGLATFLPDWLDLALLEYFLLDTLKELLLVTSTKAVEPSISNFSFAFFENKEALSIDIAHIFFVTHVEGLDYVSKIAHLFLDVLLRVFLLFLYLGKCSERVLSKLHIELFFFELFLWIETTLCAKESCLLHSDFLHLTWQSV